jgi:hypothetical protein
VRLLVQSGGEVLLHCLQHPQCSMPSHRQIIAAAAIQAYEISL